MVSVCVCVCVCTWESRDTMRDTARVVCMYFNSLVLVTVSFPFSTHQAHTTHTYRLDMMILSYTIVMMYQSTRIITNLLD